ncbi:MAG: ArnT family glycosyltransferase [Thermodesulfobacteriota bacterium]
MKVIKAPIKVRIIFPLVILLGLSALICLQRLHTYDEPLERDLTLYAVIGHELLEGRALYSDLCENKPPAVFLTYAAAEKLVGYGPGAVFLLGIFAAILTLLGVYAAGFALGGSMETGVWAAIFWTAICSSLTLQANQPNTEVFINACIIWAFVLMLRSDDRFPWLRRYIAIGALLALASLYKMVVISIAGTLSLAHLALPPGEPPDRKLAGKQIGVIAATGAVIWASVFAYFAAVGNFRDFYEIVFVFNGYYTGDVIENLRIGLTFFEGFLQYAVQLIYLICIGSLLIASHNLKRPWGLLLGLAIGTQLAVALPGKFYPHYFLYWLPTLAVALAWMIEEFGRLLPNYSLWIKCLAGIGVAVFFAGHELPNYKISSTEWSQEKYGDIFVDSKIVGKEISQLLAPGETFYEWGAESGLYFYSQRRPPAGVLFCWHLHEGFPYAAQLSKRVVQDLDKAQPELFIIGGWSLIKYKTYLLRPNPVLKWFSSRYRPFSKKGPFIFYARRGGKLEARLSNNIDPGEQGGVDFGNKVLEKVKSINFVALNQD